jgi:DNA-binding IclR family transcriptional regulator
VLLAGLLISIYFNSSSDRMKTLPKPKSADVGVISKVLRILEAIESSPSALHLKDICAQTKINKTTAYRFVAHLQREGYLCRDEGSHYSFGTKLLQLGTRLDPRATLLEMARPALRKLWKTTQETVNLGVLDEGMVLYVDVIESPHVFRMASKAGMRRPIYSTALGKAMVAFLSEEKRKGALNSQSFQSLTPRTITTLARLEEELRRIRHNGYAVDEEENLLGARCVGAPIFNHNQEPLAAVSISGPCSRICPEQIPQLGAAVRKACQAISKAMSGNVDFSGPPKKESARTSKTLKRQVRQGEKAPRHLTN